MDGVPFRSYFRVTLLAGPAAALLVMLAAGTGASVLFGRCLRTVAGWWVAAIMTVAFTGACVLVTLEVLGVLTGTPSGLLERVALFTGLGWIGTAGLRLYRYD